MGWTASSRNSVFHRNYIPVYTLSASMRYCSQSTTTKRLFHPSQKLIHTRERVKSRRRSGLPPLSGLQRAKLQHCCCCLLSRPRAHVSVRTSSSSPFTLPYYTFGMPRAACATRVWVYILPAASCHVTFSSDFRRRLRGELRVIFIVRARYTRP